MKKAVIFDMDGVLVDNNDIHVEAFTIFCKRYGVEMSAEKFVQFAGMGNDDIISYFMGREIEGEELTKLSLEKEAIYREIYSETIKPLDGLVSTLKALKDKGIKCAVGSSGITENVNFVLEKCGIAKYFDAIANGDMVTKAKPNPEVFLLASKLLGIEPKDCVVFEDSFAGIKAARNAEMKVIAVATTHPKDAHTDYDYIIEDFTQIDIDTIIE